MNNSSDKRKIYVLLIIVFIVTTFFAIPAYFLYNHTRELIFQELGNNAKSTSITIAKFIEQDIAPYKQLSSVVEYKPGSYDEIYYKKMQKLFQQLKNETGASFIYTEKWLSDTELAYVLDGEAPDSKLFSPLGSTDKMTVTEVMSFNKGTAAVSKMMNYEKWGDYLTGYAPIIDDRSGEVIGLVGVDISLQYVQYIIKNIKYIIIIGFLIMILLTSTVVYILLDMRLKAIETDYLTGLFSKRHHEYQLKRMIKDAQLRDTPLSLMMIDVDYFKQVNDQYGHLVGDEVLKSIAQIIKMNTRHFDICSHYGGDEFMIILPGTNLEQAALISNRIQEKIINIDVGNEGVDTMKITLSMGIAEWNENMSAEQLTECADQAMYRSKIMGRNTVTIYNEHTLNGI